MNKPYLPRMALHNPEKTMELAVNTLKSDSSIQDKFQAIQALGMISDRRSYNHLIEEVFNRDISETIISTLALKNDSRALFPLINVFNQTDSSDIKKTILQYISYTQDPRSTDFLNEQLNQTNVNQQMLSEALEKCINNYKFSYTFSGSDDLYYKSLNKEGQIPVSSKNLSLNRDLINKDKGTIQYRPQTYVILNNELMLIGGNLNEHVFVAKGKNVLAAGEVVFNESGDKWVVDEINYRSSGYFPAKTSFHWVKKFFNKSDLIFNKEKFDSDFPREGYNDQDFLSIHKFGKNY